MVAQMHHGRQQTGGDCPTAGAGIRRTISRELRRNRSRNGYWAVAAQTKAEARRSERPWVCKMERPEVRRYVRERLRQCWSPDEIAGRSRSDFPRRSAAARFRARRSTPGFTRSTPPEPTGGVTCGVWGVCGGARKTAGNCRPASRIEGRPAVVDRRARYGDWEGDTVVGAGRRGGAVTLVERKSGYLLLGKVRDRQAATVRQAIAQLYRTAACESAEDVDAGQRQGVCRTRAAWRRKPRCESTLPSPTVRGSAARTKTPTAWCGSSSPKAATWPACRSNGLTKVQHLLNNRPRKRLGYRTPLEVLSSRLRCD